MSKSKRKVRKLTDEQYNLYIATLKSDPALYCADGSAFIPDEIDSRSETDAKKGE